MTRARDSLTLLVVALLVAALSTSCAQAKTLHVHLDTSRWMYYPGYLLFTYVTSIPDDIPLGEEHRVCIRNFVYDGQMGEDDAMGGVTGGRQNALDTQPYAWTIEPEGQGDSRQYRSSLPVNFAKQYGLDPDVLWFGSFIAFDLDLPATASGSASWPPDALTMSLLNVDQAVALHTADPLGGDALLVCTLKPGDKDWQTNAFSPATYRRSRTGGLDTVYVPLPEPSPLAGSRVPRIHLPPRIRDARRESGVVWLEYSISVHVDRVRLRVLDTTGRERFLREASNVPPGIYGDYWPKLGGAAPPPGRYKVILEAGDQRVSKDFEL
jgi:hypothetical protein